MSTESTMVVMNTEVLDTASENIRVVLHCFRKVVIHVHSSAVSGTSPTLDVKVQRKFPREGSDWYDVTGKAMTQITAANQDQQIELDEDDLTSENMRLVVEIGGTGSPSVTTDMTMIART